MQAVEPNRSRIDDPTTFEAIQGPDGHDPTHAQLQYLKGTNAEHFESNNRSESRPEHYSAPDFVPQDSEAYDASGDGRKRRKVSIEPESHISGPTQYNLLPPPRLVENRQQRFGQRTRLGPETPETDSPKKRRGRPPKALPASQKDGLKSNNALETVPDQAQDINVLPQTQVKPDSTRKKSMRLTANGTLFSSPHSSQESKTIIKASSPKSGVKKKSSNLTLKNGKFTQTLTVRLRYNGSGNTGEKINEILFSEGTIANVKEPVNKSHPATEYSKRTTHPFFLGKVAVRATPQDTPIVDAGSKAVDSQDENSSKPTPWKDIVFKSKKPSFSKALQKPAWPPHVFQHIGRETFEGVKSPQNTDHSNKQKARSANTIADSENVLELRASTLVSEASSNKQCAPRQRRHCTPREVIQMLTVNVDVATQYDPVAAVRKKGLTSLSAFDRGHAAGPLPWSQKYGPGCWQEVLQPSCQQLHDWLKGLAIHQVQSGTEKGHSKLPLKRKKKARKHDDELNDFIVDDNMEHDDARIKNSILIVGPNGCGKTASVYAVAKQLGFEVFEIHSGMRRSQKDIFDKVGDMAQNHLVQGGDRAVSRDSSVVPGSEATLEQDVSAQSAISRLLSKPATKIVNQSTTATPIPSKEQKQSLILFEEVDHVFEDDRGFWSGVQALIQNSKRPVILTCNTLHDVPIDELDLFKILSYSPPPIYVVGEYLCYVAAAEGHIIQPEVVRDLYSSKHNDLRATMMELDLWCQMTVGSERGGLDWFPHYDFGHSGRSERLRVISENTFTTAMNLLPTAQAELADNLMFLQSESEVPLCRWIECASTITASSTVADLSAWMNSVLHSSDFDLLDISTQSFMAAQVWPIERSDVSSLRYCSQKWCTELTYEAQLIARPHFASLQPLSVERPVFPPSQGRHAPSLDESRNVIAADLAPYVRSIAAYDLGLETYRAEVCSSQGRKVRTTRAARAAAEGGEKAFTRPERWLPPDLDLRAVLATGGNWPQWVTYTSSSQASSPFETLPNEDKIPGQPAPEQNIFA